MTDHRRVQKWREWIEGPLSTEVVLMHDYRRMWRRLGEMIAENDSLPDSDWWPFMRDTYGVTQAMAVRRQAESDDARTHALGRLIAEIGDAPNNFGRAEWIDLWHLVPGTTRFAEAKWAEYFAGNTATTQLDPRVPLADLDSLKAIANPVKRFADRELAHSDRRPVISLSFDELNAAIDVIGHLFQKYEFLLMAHATRPPMSIEPPDLMDVFRQPWQRHPD